MQKSRKVPVILVDLCQLCKSPEIQKFDTVICQQRKLEVQSGNLPTAVFRYSILSAESGIWRFGLVICRQRHLEVRSWILPAGKIESDALRFGWRQSSSRSWCAWLSARIGLPDADRSTVTSFVRRQMYIKHLILQSIRQWSLLRTFWGCACRLCCNQ